MVHEGPLDLFLVLAFLFHALFRRYVATHPSILSSCASWSMLWNINLTWGGQPSAQVGHLRFCRNAILFNRFQTILIARL